MDNSGSTPMPVGNSKARSTATRWHSFGATGTSMAANRGHWRSVRMAAAGRIQCRIPVVGRGAGRATTPPLAERSKRTRGQARTQRHGRRCRMRDCRRGRLRRRDGDRHPGRDRDSRLRGLHEACGVDAAHCGDDDDQDTDQRGLCARRRLSIESSDVPTGFSEVWTGRFEDGTCGAQFTFDDVARLPGVKGKKLWFWLDESGTGWKCSSDLENKILPASCRG